MTRTEEFAQANRAFELFTLDERAKALEIFARLKYASMIDRFFEAVYQVIQEQASARQEEP